jgi:hypothetical protein
MKEGLKMINNVNMKTKFVVTRNMKLLVNASFIFERTFHWTFYLYLVLSFVYEFTRRPVNQNENNATFGFTFLHELSPAGLV